MSSLITAAVTALVSVVCLEPIRFNKKRYGVGERIDGLTEEQADQLIDMGHADPAPVKWPVVAQAQDSVEAQVAAAVAVRVDSALAKASQALAELQDRLEKAESGKADAEAALAEANLAAAGQTGVDAASDAGTPATGTTDAAELAEADKAVAAKTVAAKKK